MKKSKPYSELGFAKVDHRRKHYQGCPEIVFGQGKTPAQVLGIARKLYQHEKFVLVTRATPEQATVLCEEFPKARWHETARIIQLGSANRTRSKSLVAVLAAGTSDLPVAEEAAVTLEALGFQTRRVYDVGVAGLHRLLAHEHVLKTASVFIVTAGMEGALPSVVAGLVKAPVIAVPTSVGYGASFGGIAALLGMLNSCGSGVTVVNIDNGFGAAMGAVRILQKK